MKESREGERPGPAFSSPSPERTAASRRALRLVEGAALLCAGCGGALPLLHPARVLPTGEVRVAVGMSGEVAAGGLASALRQGSNEASAGGAQRSPIDPTYAEGALVAAAVGPGLAPVVSARVGLGSGLEGGLTYAGRAIRADVRRSFDLATSWALSVGAAGSGVLYDHEPASAGTIVNLDELHGWGADAPILVGYHSDGDLYMAWFGARAGWEHVEIGDLTSEPGAAQFGASPVPLSATRFWGGGVVGIAIGFRHVHVAMEMDASYVSLSGSLGTQQAHISGVALAPASALFWRF